MWWLLNTQSINALVKTTVWLFYYMQFLTNKILNLLQTSTDHIKTVYYSAKYTVNKWDKKPSYCRDSAGRRSLRCARLLFKVTDFGTDRKHVCDFLFVNNTNLYRPFVRYRAVLIKLSLFDRRCLSLTNSFLEKPIAIIHILLKNLIIWTTFLSQTVCVCLQPITQNNGHYAVPGHSRSPILVPINQKPIWNFLLVIHANLPSYLSQFPSYCR